MFFPILYGLGIFKILLKIRIRQRAHQLSKIQRELEAKIYFMRNTIWRHHQKIGFQSANMLFVVLACYVLRALYNTITPILPADWSL